MVVIIFWISALLIVYAYMLYPAILFGFDRLAGKRNFKQTDELPPISIIIAAYNEDKVIKSRIENCLALDYPVEKMEIIIASDGSDDGTNGIVRGYADKGINLFDFKERRGKVNVLNDTVAKAAHDIIVFSDANTMFKRDAMKKLVRHFGDEKVGCVCGGLYFINAEGSKIGDLEGIYWRYETMLKKMEGRRGSLLGANGAIYAIRKNLFVNCPTDTIIEDFVIPMRILNRGFAIIYDPEANAIEEAAQKIVHEKHRRIRIGAGDFQALFRLLPMLNPLKGFSALAFWSHKVLRWFAPFFLIIAFVSNLFLVGHSLYFTFFVMQCLFYTCAFIGQTLSWSGLNIKVFNICYYFVSMNLALLLGFVRFVAGGQNVAWRRTER